MAPVAQGSLARSGLLTLLSPTLQKERRLLQNRRLDLDACKARLKKAKAAEAKATVSAPASPRARKLYWGSRDGARKGPGVWHVLPPWLGLDCSLVRSWFLSPPHGILMAPGQTVMR